MRYQPSQPVRDLPADLGHPVDQHGRAHPDGIVVDSWPEPRPPLPATTWAAAVCGLAERTGRAIQSSEDWYVNFARAVGGFQDILPNLSVPIPETHPWPSLSFSDGTVPASLPPRQEPKAPPPQRRAVLRRPAPGTDHGPPAHKAKAGITQRRPHVDLSRNVGHGGPHMETRPSNDATYLGPRTKARSAVQAAPPARHSLATVPEERTSAPSPHDRQLN